MASNGTFPSRVDCDDSSLSVTANILGILTFVYAIGLGGWFRFRIVKESPEQMQHFMRTLHDQIDELRQFLRDHMTFEFDAKTQDSKGQAAKAASETMELLGQLRDIARQIMQSPSGWWSRSSYVLMQQQLNEKMIEKDKAMDNFRLARERYEQLQITVDRQRRVDFQRRQEDILQQQQRLLHDIVSRLEALEARQPTMASDLT